MLSKIIRFLFVILARQRISIALSKGALSQSLRNIDHCDPKTWEFSAFSQNGEDGIIDYLCANIKVPNRYFIEIGSSDGVENNTAFLAVVKKYSGIMIEGNKAASALSKKIMSSMNLGVEAINIFVTKDNIPDLLQSALYSDPDFFSLDIDGNDFYVAENLFKAGLKPAVVAVEYNSTLGEEKSITIKYQENFDFTKAHSTELFYGVSVKGWTKFFEGLGYKFITVDQNGVNAFFIDPERFESNFYEAIQGYAYKENFYELRKFKLKNDLRFELIKNMDFVSI